MDMSPEAAGKSDAGGPEQAARRHESMADPYAAPVQSPPWPPPAGDAPSSGPFWRGDRLVDPRVGESDRLLSILVHLWWVFGLVLLGPLALILPVVVWAVRQQASGFVDDHGREVLNLQLTLAILVLIPIFWIVLPVWLVVAIVNSIRAAVAAGRNEHFRYPMIVRVIR